MFDLWEEPRRKPIPMSLQKQLLLRSKGKCEECGLDFYKSGVKPHFHHIDGNPKNNKLENLIVLCPNCHSKMHKWKTVTKRDWFGFTYKERKLVTIKPKKLKITSKRKTKKKSTAKKAVKKPSRRTTKKKTTKTKKTTSKKNLKRKNPLERKQPKQSVKEKGKKKNQYGIYSSQDFCMRYFR